jgi:hypothetical protein
METVTENTPHPPIGFDAPRQPRYPPWEALVNPSRVFVDPRDVVVAPDLSLEEKRAILASWASDAWAVESAPALRHFPGLLGCHVPLDAVLDALQSLDPEPDPTAAHTGTSNTATSRRPCRIRWLMPRLSRTR